MAPILPVQTFRTEPSGSQGSISDTQIWIYEGIFDPNNPLNNVLAVNEDIDFEISSGTHGNWLSSIQDITLNSGTTYVLVVTSYTAGVEGNVSFSITGPGSVGVAGDTITTPPAPSNNAPFLTGTPTDITTTEDTASNVDLSSVTFADDDGDNLTVTLSASTGTLTATSGSRVTVGGSGTGALTLAGAASDINAFLDTLSNVQYTGALNANGDNA